MASRPGSAPTMFFSASSSRPVSVPPAIIVKPISRARSIQAASVAMKPAALPWRRQACDHLAHRRVEARVVELAGDAHEVGQVEMADPQHVDAFDGGDLIDLLQTALGLDLRDDQRALVVACGSSRRHRHRGSRIARSRTRHRAGRPAGSGRPARSSAPALPTRPSGSSRRARPGPARARARCIHRAARAPSARSAGRGNSRTTTSSVSKPRPVCSMS